MIFHVNGIKRFILIQHYYIQQHNIFSLLEIVNMKFILKTFTFFSTYRIIEI